MTQQWFVYLTFSVDILPKVFNDTSLFCFPIYGNDLFKVFQQIAIRAIHYFRFFTSSSRSTTTPMSVDQTFFWNACTKNFVYRGNSSRDFGPLEPRVSKNRRPLRKNTTMADGKIYDPSYAPVRIITYIQPTGIVFLRTRTIIIG